MDYPSFIVDTHLLRELGDLLVGRDSTAVIELVKNSYDADATVVRVDAQNLSIPDSAVLTVEDNGNGMTSERFRSAFLRIAGREKEEGDRQSPRFRRTYTGQKGIGRLASQKLATVLDIASRPDPRIFGNSSSGVDAHIDWAEIDKQDRLDRLSSGLTVKDVAIVEGVPSGTTLSLRFLKRKWTSKDVSLFVTELQSAQPPALLMETGADQLAINGESLIGAPMVRQSSDDDPGFIIELTGELAAGDDLWTRAAEDFHWLVEIDVANRRARYRLSPTTSYVRSEPLAQTYSFEADTDEDIRFQARFYMMPNASAQRGPLKGFVRSSSGIRVYLEGFRVLPYGEYGDDWLSIDRDYRSGPRYYELDIDESASDQLDIDRKEGLNAIASNGYFGAVFLTTSGTPGLQSLINREGFVPGPTFSTIQQIVQTGVRLSVRVRRSIHNQRARLNALPRTYADQEANRMASNPPSATTDSEPSTRASFDLMATRITSADEDKKIVAATNAAASLAAEVIGSTGMATTDSGQLQALVEGFQVAQEALQVVQSLQPELRTLAGVGLQLGAFVHDINGMLASTNTIRELLKSLLNNVVLPEQRSAIRAILVAADELAHSLARQSSYLTDVLSTDPRRRRSQVKVKDRINGVLRFLASRIAEKNIAVHVDVDGNLRTGPMFPAELTILLTNLLTNAVKNAASPGQIWITGRDRGDSIELTISNDGATVNLDEAERWFLPFESTTTTVDDVLGQGMGLGLPISRALVNDYRGDVRFIPPLHGVGTSIRIILPRRDTRK